MLILGLRNAVFLEKGKKKTIRTSRMVFVYGF